MRQRLQKKSSASEQHMALTQVMEPKVQQNKEEKAPKTGFEVPDLTPLLKIVKKRPWQRAISQAFRIRQWQTL